jgi:hypothetical protein
MLLKQEIKLLTKPEASHRQQIRQLLPQLLGNKQVHPDIKLTGN